MKETLLYYFRRVGGAPARVARCPTPLVKVPSTAGPRRRTHSAWPDSGPAAHAPRGGALRPPLRVQVDVAGVRARVQRRQGVAAAREPRARGIAAGGRRDRVAQRRPGVQAQVRAALRPSPTARGSESPEIWTINVGQVWANIWLVILPSSADFGGGKKRAGVP